ncbi:MAG: hypothetical protein ABR613_03590 [Actinomycetota bacterium]
MLALGNRHLPVLLVLAAASWVARSYGRKAGGSSRRSSGSGDTSTNSPAGLFAAGLGVAAGKNHGDGRVNRQAFRIARAAGTATSDEFVRLTGMSLPVANARGR